MPVRCSWSRNKENYPPYEITAPSLSRPGSCFFVYSSSELYTCLSVLMVVSSSSAMHSLAPPAACLPQCGPPCLPAWLPHVPCPPLTQACVLTPTNQCAVTQRHASGFPPPPVFFVSLQACQAVAGVSHCRCSRLKQTRTVKSIVTILLLLLLVQNL